MCVRAFMYATLYACIIVSFVDYDFMFGNIVKLMPIPPFPTHLFLRPSLLSPLIHHSAYL